jgi:hypothetical protein
MSLNSLALSASSEISRQSRALKGVNAVSVRNRATAVGHPVPRSRRIEAGAEAIAVTAGYKTLASALNAIEFVNPVWRRQVEVASTCYRRHEGPHAMAPTDAALMWDTAGLLRDRGTGRTNTAM